MNFITLIILCDLLTRDITCIYSMVLCRLTNLFVPGKITKTLQFDDLLFLLLTVAIDLFILHVNAYKN